MVSAGEEEDTGQPKSPPCTSAAESGVESGVVSFDNKVPYFKIKLSQIGFQRCDI